MINAITTCKFENKVRIGEISITSINRVDYQGVYILMENQTLIITLVNFAKRQAKKYMS